MGLIHLLHCGAQSGNLKSQNRRFSAESLSFLCFNAYWIGNQIGCDLWNNILSTGQTSSFETCLLYFKFHLIWDGALWREGQTQSQCTLVMSKIVYEYLRGNAVILTPVPLTEQDVHYVASCHITCSTQYTRNAAVVYKLARPFWHADGAVLPSTASLFRVGKTMPICSHRTEWIALLTQFAEISESCVAVVCIERYKKNVGMSFHFLPYISEDNKSLKQRLPQKLYTRTVYEWWCTRPAFRGLYILRSYFSAFFQFNV